MGVRGPKSAGVTLADITPEALAKEVEQAIARQINRMSFALGPAYSYMSQHKNGSFTQIGVTCADLLAFAQKGDCADWGDPAGAVDAIQSVCEALYSQAGVGEVELSELVSDTTPETTYGVVLRAAYARHQILAGEDVTGGQLAALSGLSVHGLRHLRDVGEITFAQRDTITAGEARRFLASRGIAV
jgi:hypothetical protein